MRSAIKSGLHLRQYTTIEKDRSTSKQKEDDTAVGQLGQNLFVLCKMN